jgi:hypothetical protein
MMIGLTDLMMRETLGYLTKKLSKGNAKVT